jgi:hypothetical protein
MDYAVFIIDCLLIVCSATLDIGGDEHITLELR